jgi:hypothetical protein
VNYGMENIISITGINLSGLTKCKLVYSETANEFTSIENTVEIISSTNMICKIDEITNSELIGEEFVLGISTNEGYQWVFAYNFPLIYSPEIKIIQIEPNNLFIGTNLLQILFNQDLTNYPLLFKIGELQSNEYEFVSQISLVIKFEIEKNLEINTTFLSV